MENLTEVFKCFICLGNLELAHMCPHCSQLGCYPCILQRLVVLQQSQCPYCQRTLRLGDLINCRWVEHVSQQLVGGNTKEDLCTTHDEKISAFCLNCEKCICHRCALWSEIHSNHVFKPLEEVCLFHIDMIKEGLIYYWNRHSEVKGILTEIEKTVEHLDDANDKHLDTNLGKKLQRNQPFLIIKKRLLSKECFKIESNLDSLEKELMTCSRSELFSTSKRITQSLSELKGFRLTNYQKFNADDLFSSEVIPPYENGTFVLSNFSHLQLKEVPVYSPPLRTLGSTWRLKVFPAGKGISNKEYLSVHLELTSLFTESSKYQYKVEMVHQVSEDPSNSKVQEFTSNFNVGKSLGFDRFYLLNRLASEGYLKDDTLVLKFGVRFLSYYEKSRVQEEFINQLQTKINVLGK